MPESTCVYVYTNLGYKGMTLTNNCSYFVCFPFPSFISILKFSRETESMGTMVDLHIYQFIYFQELMNMIMEEYQDLKLTS